MKKTVYTTATAVTALSAAKRGLGFLYRIVLSRLLGAEGLGLYQVALSLSSLFLTVGTGGIPVTVSRMISKSKAEKLPMDEVHVLSAGAFLSLILTLPVCLFLLFFGDRLTFLFSDERTFSVFRILLIALCLSSLYAVLRGSFWGNKQFLLPSVLELAEESVMVIAGVVLLQRVDSPLSGAERAAWAVVISCLFSFTAAVLCFFIKGGKLSSPTKMLKPLFNATIPLTSVRICASLINSAVAVLLPVTLIRTGLDNSEAVAQFGIISGMVIPVLFIPSTLIGSLALVLVPELSEDFYRGNVDRLKKNIERGLLFSVLVACILLPFFYAVGTELGMLAFANPTAGEMISHACPLLLPMSLTMISTSILNSMGFEKRTFLFYFVGAAALLLCILLLPGLCGSYAYLIGLGISYTATAACNLVFLYKKCPVFKKRGRQICVHILFPAIFGVLFISISGRICMSLLTHVLGDFFALVSSVFVMLLATAVLYLATGILPNPFSKKKD